MHAFCKFSVFPCELFTKRYIIQNEDVFIQMSPTKRTPALDIDYKILHAIWKLILIKYGRYLPIKFLKQV